MEEILLDILLGLGSGAIIAGIALGVVLTFRGSGSSTSSTGAMAMLGGYAFWSLTTGKIATLPMAAALPLACCSWSPCGALVEFAVFRPLRTSSPLARLMSSLGVLLIAQAACCSRSAPPRSRSRRPAAERDRAARRAGSGSTCSSSPA